MTFVGLDLHKRYITACALDAAGTVLGEVRRVPVAIDYLLDFLGAFPAPVIVGMEATLYWQWLHDGLEGAGYTARVADARQVKLIWQARSKTDPIDARKLAELLRVNLFPTVWIPDADTRRRRQLLHARGFLVRQRTRIKDRIHGRLTAENLLCPRSDLYGRAGRAWLATVALSPMLRSQVERLLRVHDALTQEIHEMDEQVKRLGRDHPMIERLHTIPGVGLWATSTGGSSARRGNQKQRRRRRGSSAAISAAISIGCGRTAWATRNGSSSAGMHDGRRCARCNAWERWCRSSSSPPSTR
jgi:transposase